jgi:hypothetical protein
MKNLLHSPHRRWVLLTVCVAACSPTESSPEVERESGNMQSMSEPGPLAPGVMPPARPIECMGSFDKPCMRYRIPLVGNPSSDAALRNKYIVAFGSACYVSEVNTFDCFYKTWQAACADAAKIGEVSGNAPYDKGYTCQPVGNGSDDYTLQIGPDVANKITINYQKAPRETPLIPVNGTPTEVNGPYRNLPVPDKLGPGYDFHCADVVNNGTEMSQWKWILQLNRNAHGGEVHSDLAGFTWPCQDNGIPKTCTEPLVLKDPGQKETPPYDPLAAQVHHVVPMKDKRSCPWGTNSNKNAAVISRTLNIYLTNNYPPANEVVQINKIAAYVP